MRRSYISGSRIIAVTVVAAALAVAPLLARAYDERGPEPTASYSSLEAARDSIGVMVGRAVHEISPPHHRGLFDTAGSAGAAGAGSAGGAVDTMIQVTRAPAKFKYWYANASANGWSYRIVIRDTSECPLMKLEYALDAAGWSPDHGYAADAPDGSVMGFVSKGYFCMVEGRWDGGDDSDDTDGTVEITPGCEVTVTCVPRRADDVPKY